MIREYFRAVRYALSGRICTRLFKGTYAVAMHGEPGWEPKGDPVLYYVYPKRQVWTEAIPLDGENYKIVQREVQSGKWGLGYGFMGSSETRPILRDGIQIFSKQEALEVLARREVSLQKDGWDGYLQVKRNWLFDLRHFRRFVAKNGPSSQPVPVA